MCDKGSRIPFYKLLTRLSFLAAAGLFCISGPVCAQQGNPEVYIDMGVLQGLGSASAQPRQPVKLRPPASHQPAANTMQPRLIAPTQNAPAYNAPPVKSAPIPVMAVKSVPQPQPTPKIYVSKPPGIPPDDGRRASPSIATVTKTIEPVAAKEPIPVAPIVPAVIPEVKPAVAAVNETPKTAARPEPVTFPIETKTRRETSDPASDTTSRPVPVRTGIAGNLKDVVPSRPAPDFDPAVAPEPAPAAPLRDLTEKTAETPKVETAKVKTSKELPVIPGRKPAIETKTAGIPAKEKYAAGAISGKPPVLPPIPPERPAVQKASPELVAELREREEKKIEAEIKTAQTSTIDIANPPPPPGPRGKKNMPAVAKAPVDSEPLQEQLVMLPVTSDPLLDRLVEKDKESLVATIESLVAAREDGKPLPDTGKPKREQGTNIVKAEPMQRPYNVYRPKKAEETASVPAEETKLASLPDTIPAAPTPRPPPQRSQDEQVYVSVPFGEGLTDVDATITGEIETRLLPILNDNPAWKLQIQAFASPVKDGVSSARKASLARALAVRTYLISKGIEATRMDVRALGAESDRDPMDRVDLIVFDPAEKS